MSNPLQIFRDILTDKGLIPAEIMAENCIVVLPRPNRINKTAHISRMSISLRHFGGATGKMVNRARSAQKKSKRFPCLNFPHGGNVNTPYSGNAKRNMPNAMLKQLNWPDRNGTRH